MFPVVNVLVTLGKIDLMPSIGKDYSMKHALLILLVILTSLQWAASQTPQGFSIIAYYSAGPEQVDSIAAEKLTHIIYSFCHLSGNALIVSTKKDSTTIEKLSALKKQNPNLKVILSLGGWGGCMTCSDVFSSDKGRKEFSESVLKLNQYFHTDGLDLDWEYPAIEGYPSHPYRPEDKTNFTALLKQLRRTMGPTYELSFAAGGFQKYLEQSVDWHAVMKIVNRVNVMSYDLVGGYSQVTGHHTALYSNPSQHESTDNAVQYLINIGVPRNKIVIGAAFYARVWAGVAPERNGLYQPGQFKMGVDYKNFATGLKGFEMYWDDSSQAPYGYHSVDKLFATYDNEKSVELKTNYALDQKLNGIMFWELSLDKRNGGLLDCIYTAKTRYGQ